MVSDMQSSSSPDSDFVLCQNLYSGFFVHHTRLHYHSMQSHSSLVASQDHLRSLDSDPEIHTDRVEAEVGAYSEAFEASQIGILAERSRSPL